MKMFASIALLAALFSIASAEDAKKEMSTAPKQATISVDRAFVKPGHEEDFKKAIAAHAQAVAT